MGKIDVHKDEIIRLYKKGITLENIGDSFGCCSATIRHGLIDWGIRIRNKYKKVIIGKNENPLIYNPYTLFKESEISNSKLYFPDGKDLVYFDNSIRGNECALVNKKRKELDEWYNRFSEVRYGSGYGKEERALTLSKINDKIEVLESELGMETKESEDYVLVEVETVGEYNYESWGRRRVK